MKNWLIGILAIIVVALVVTSVQQDRRITNLEHQLLRVEQEYQAVITENHKLVRMNEQNLRLMAEGGWDGFNPVYTTGAGD